jgi:hypothetical protein
VEELPQRLGTLLNWQTGLSIYHPGGDCGLSHFFGHFSFDSAGNIGDLNVLNASPLMERMVDGTFHKHEEKAEVVSFEIGDKEFTKGFILVDGVGLWKISRSQRPWRRRNTHLAGGLQDGCRESLWRTEGHMTDLASTHPVAQVHGNLFKNNLLRHPPQHACCWQMHGGQL